MADEDDDQHLFRRALESMTAADVFRGKFGEAPTQNDDADTDGAESDLAESVSREELDRLRQVREMEDAFAGIDPIERGKYHRRTPAQEALEEGFGDADAEFAAAMTHAAPDPKPPPPQRSLAEQAPEDTPSKNLRGLSPDEALRQLGLFVDLASKDGHAFVHLKVGSNSDLLKAVTQWLKGPGSVYLDEFQPVEVHGDAAVFARIRREEHS